MSFQPFFRKLLLDGTIPYQRYAISADNGKIGSGDCLTIDSPDFLSKCMRVNVIETAPVEGARVSLTSLIRKFEFVFRGGEWVIARNWTRPTFNIEMFEK